MICEYDYSASPIADILNASVRDAVMFMVANKKWKLIHCEGGYRPILFDLENDPGETKDIAAEYPQKFQSMLALWEEYVTLNNVILLPDTGE